MKPSGIEMAELPFIRIRLLKNDNLGHPRGLSNFTSSSEGTVLVEGSLLSKPWTKPLPLLVTDLFSSIWQIFGHSRDSVMAIKVEALATMSGEGSVLVRVSEEDVAQSGVNCELLEVSGKGTMLDAQMTPTKNSYQSRQSTRVQSALCCRIRANRVK